MDLPTLRGLSLCSGVGGLDLGVSLACRSLGVDYRTICHVEREAYAASVLAARVEDGTMAPAPIWSDLRTFDGGPWRGAVDLLTAGYPCTPFSLAGHRRGAADPRHIWPEVARIVSESRPALVFCENVSDHLSLGFDVVVADMERLGYRTAAVVATAWAVGAPHIRERLFWLATDANSGNIRPQRGRAESRPGQAGPRDDGAARESSDADCLHGQAQWDDAMRHDPWDWRPTKPAICRGNDDSPARVDRLRALGNGVVPQVARNAFLVLVEELFG